MVLVEMAHFLLHMHNVIYFDSHTYTNYLLFL